MERIVELAADGLHVSTHRGFLSVSRDGETVGNVALDDIGALIAHAHGLTWSNNAFVRLSERKVPVVLCAANHAPIACVWPLEGHYAQGARMRAQAACGKPLRKQLWRNIVVAKIRMQAAVLAANGQTGADLELLARKVRSGDPDNMEAQAARLYWPRMFGPDFRRDRSAGGVNAHLNYGYTVLRALVSRAVCASGLHPTLGLHHSNRANAFALSDDLMEPFRPLVDQVVRNTVCGETRGPDSEAKRNLAAIATLDLSAGMVTSTVTQQIRHLVRSVAEALETGRRAISVPCPPDPEILRSLGHEHERQ